MGGIANRECKNQTNVYMGANFGKKNRDRKDVKEIKKSTKRKQNR